MKGDTLEVLRTNRIQLSGRNGVLVPRGVYEIDSAGAEHEIDLHEMLWEALDFQGRSHGDRWLTDWFAADALSRYLLNAKNGSWGWCKLCRSYHDPLNLTCKGWRERT